MRRILAGIGVALAALPAVASAQTDVVELGRQYGTVPPEGYFETLRRDPDAFRFDRAMQARNPRLRLLEPGGDGPPQLLVDGGAVATGPAAIGPRDGPVTGTFRFPLVLGYYADMGGAPPFTRAAVQQEFFDGPNSRYQTITEYYDEISGGRVTLEGVTIDWAQSSLTGTQVTGASNGLGGDSRVDDFIKDLLAAADDGSIDWGQFDNDGPDGIPNSGDDDGWVDLLAVFHPTDGAECNPSAGKVWSHKYSLSAWGSGHYVTSSPSASGGFVKVDDYAIQPVWDCGGSAINEIGVFTHELGHGFGLPDLYCTAIGCAHEGIGRWGLMGSGSWGCGSHDPARPCHMNAWSKEQLGWADVVELDPGQDFGALTLPPVETSGTVYRVEAQDGSGEYLLLENRQPIGFDAGLFEPGLLVWHIDGPMVAGNWPLNRVNNLSTRLGVWLRQADDEGDLESTGPNGNRGDTGDPFPGSAGNTAFHVASFPAALTHAGNASGLTLVDIANAGGQQVTFRALTRFQTIAVETGGTTTEGLLTVDGQAAPGASTSFPSAPFETHRIEAAAGAPVSPGRRQAFEGWTDDGDAPRIRTIVTGFEDATYTAGYGELQVELDIELLGGAFEVEPGRVTSDPFSDDLWFPEGANVSLTAEPTPGFDFLGWGGALDGSPNPVTLTLDDPLQASALFELTYAFPEVVEVTIEAGSEPGVSLATPEGTAPFAWVRTDGSLPFGVTLTEDGVLQGVPMQEGSFPLDLRVTDANGLRATGSMTLVVAPPDLELDELAAPLLGVGAQPTTDQLTYLDRQGNSDGLYDVGDLRVFLRAHPELPASIAASKGEIVLPFVFRPGGNR